MILPSMVLPSLFDKGSDQSSPKGYAPASNGGGKGTNSPGIAPAAGKETHNPCTRTEFGAGRGSQR